VVAGAAQEDLEAVAVGADRARQDGLARERAHLGASGARVGLDLLARPRGGDATLVVDEHRALRAEGLVDVDPVGGEQLHDQAPSAARARRA
jgi:hypothetical protein